jgi:predicted esterase
VTTEHHLVVQRTARYFMLGRATGETTDVWVVCHGYGQLAASFLASFEPIASPSRLVVAPEALSRFYLDRERRAEDPDPRVGATWMTREDRDHEIADHVTYLDALAEHVRGPLASNRVRLCALGFSQGVATVARWVARGRVRVDELILWAGAFPPDVDLAAFRDRLAGARVAVVVGERDSLAPWAAADAQLERFIAAGIDARRLSFEGGHRLDDATLVALTTGA